MATGSFHLPRSAVAAVFGAVVVLGGCERSAPIILSGGQAELNSRLRADFGASGTTTPRFYADGNCPATAAPNDSCRHMSPLLPNTIEPAHLRHLRRSDYLWVESAGSLRLSYEFTATNVTVFELPHNPFAIFTSFFGSSSPQQRQVISRDVAIGTCPQAPNGPLKDPQTRQPVRGMETKILPGEARAYASAFDVWLNGCTDPLALDRPSETLAPASERCSSAPGQNMLDFLPAVIPSQHNPPLCQTGVPVPGQSGLRDISYTLTPKPAEYPFTASLRQWFPLAAQLLEGYAKVRFEEVWENASLPTQTLLPHVKVVPVHGVRTIARPMQRIEHGTGPDGSQVSEWQFRLRPGGTSGWDENFSPHIVSVRARVRRGNWSGPDGGNYLPMERLKIGTVTCDPGARTGNHGGNEFDVVLCRSAGPMLRVTPGYPFDALSSRPIDDNDSLVWNVRILLSPRDTPLAENSPVFLELDLTALDPFSKGPGTGILVDPRSRDLGNFPLSAGGPSPVPARAAFTVHNSGVTGVRVTRVFLTGGDAVEFGAVQLHPPGAGPSPTLPPAVPAPADLHGGEKLTISVAPQFRSVGAKRTDVIVEYLDVYNIPGRLQAVLTASAAN